MNKKIIITIVTITVLVVGSLIGYNVYQNSKQEVPAKTTEIVEKANKVVEDDKEKAPTEEQKKDTEVVLDAEKAQAVFQSLYNAIYTIDYNDAEQVKKQEKIIRETTHPALTNITLKRNTEGKQNPYKSELKSLNIKEIKKTEYELKDKDFNAFKIIYDCIVVGDEEESKLNDSSSIVVLDSDNKYKVMNFNVPLKK